MGLLDDAIREHLDLKRRRGADPAEVERAEQEALGPVRRAPERVPGDELEDEQSPHLDHVFEDELDSGYAEEPGGRSLADGPAQPFDEALAPVEEHSYGAGGDEPLLSGLEPTEVHEYEDVRHFEPPEGEADEGWSYEDEAHAEGAAEPPGDRLAEPLAGEPRRADPAPPPVSAEPPVTPPPAAAETFSEREDVAGPGHPKSDPADFAGGETVEFDVEEALGERRRRRRPEDLEPAPGPGPEPAGPVDEDVLEETPEFLQDTPEHDRLWFEQRPPKDFDFDG